MGNDVDFYYCSKLMVSQPATKFILIYLLCSRLDTIAHKLVNRAELLVLFYYEKFLYWLFVAVLFTCLLLANNHP